MLSEQKLRVLIVDDNPAIVTLLGKFVTDLSFDAVRAIDPRDALELASLQEFHIAVIDCQMPGMEGIQLMKLLRHLHDDLEVILISGNYTEEDAAEAVLSGAYDLLRKPIDFARMSEVLYAIRDHVLRRME